MPTSNKICKVSLHICLACIKNIIYALTVRYFIGPTCVVNRFRPHAHPMGFENGFDRTQSARDF